MEFEVEKAQQEVNSALQLVKGVIYGHDGHEPQTDQVALLAQDVYNTNVIPALIRNLSKLDFEANSISSVVLFP